MKPAPKSPITAAELSELGYSQRYALALLDLLKVEGGFVDDKADHGGATKCGISLRFLASEGAFDSDGDGKADFDLDMDGDIDREDIRALSQADAAVLYHRCFWQPLGCDALPRPLGEMLFDQGVNGGRVAAIKLLQRALNTLLLNAHYATKRPSPLVVDGQFGPASREAVQWVLRNPAQGMPALIDMYREAVRERYRSIVRRNPSQQRFLRGWLARAERLGR